MISKFLIPVQLPEDIIGQIFAFFGEWEGIEVHRNPKSQWALGFVRFKNANSANFAVRNEVTITITDNCVSSDITLGYGNFYCVRAIGDGFVEVNESSLFV